ncbi:MAG: CocE/NonD family hydrolase [Woeseia sp.]
MIIRRTGPLITALLMVAFSGCGVRVAEDVPIEMRDGIRLMTDIYLPPGRGPFPVIISRVPYGTRTDYIFQPAVGRFFADNGFGYITQNVRGRFGSEGEFTAYTSDDEINDAYDTIDWIISQEWSNGIVGVMGESYYGYTALAAAASGHSAIKAISPANITLAREKQVLDGAFPLQASGLWTLDMDDADDGQYRDTEQIDLYHLPLITMGEAYGLRDELWRERVSGYLDDPGAKRDKALEDYGKIRVPALHFGGWYDTFTRGSIAIWEGVRLYGGDVDASEMQWLVMGPWDHDAMSIHLAGESAPMTVGRRDIGGEFVSVYGDTLLEFFTYFLKREDNGFIDLPRLQYFNIGDNDWRYSEQWPPERSRLRSLYFHSEGDAAAADDGFLDFVPPSDEPFDSYTYDPRDPVSITEDSDVWNRASNLPDRSVLLARDDVLTYVTGPLRNDLDITGPIAVELYASSSATDTDFTAALVDVYPDGYSLLIQEGILRASFRDRDPDPSPIEPGRVYTFMIDLWATSYTVPAGHRIRVEISSSNFPRFARNLNNGEPFGTSDRVEIAEQSIYHTRRYPSRLVLPVMTPP